MLVFQGDGDAMAPALTSAAQPFRETARQPPPARTPSPRLANGPSILKADSCIALGLLFSRHLLHRPKSLRSSAPSHHLLLLPGPRVYPRFRLDRLPLLITPPTTRPPPSRRLHAISALSTAQQFAASKACNYELCALSLFLFACVEWLLTTNIVTNMLNKLHGQPDSYDRKFVPRFYLPTSPGQQTVYNRASYQRCWPDSLRRPLLWSYLGRTTC